MLSTLDAELRPFVDLAASFAVKELAGKTEENDRYPFGPFFGDTLDKAYEVGFLGVTLPEDAGGIGQGISTLYVILEHICRFDSSLGGIVFTNALSQEIMMAAGLGQAARKIFLKASRSREYLVAFPSFCNPGQIVTLPAASRSGKGYVLSGALEYLVLGPIASHALVPARFEGGEGYSFFLVSLHDSGVILGEPIFSLGLHACPSADVEFEGAKAQIVGGEGQGAAYFDAVSPRMYIAAAAMSAGIMRGSFQEAAAYASERSQGGREIVGWSEVSMILAGMRIKLDVADLCVSQACRMLEAGVDGSGRQAISAALHIHELACDVVTDGVQVLGGNGYMKDYGQEKRYRDARQVQSLLGIAPMKKLALIRECLGAGHAGG